MNVEKKNQLIERIKTLEGLTGEERSNLLDLLRTSYGLVWEDKPEEVEDHLREEMPVLIEDRGKALTDGGPDAPNHVLIEGDNLEALTALAYTHAGKIDVIYIDPPYNTGKKDDFVYNDKIVDYEDCYRHSKWLSFMSKRLRIAKRLLSDRGAIFISIDDNEEANLKLLCNDIFGEAFFVTDIAWRSSDSSNHDAKKFSVDYNHTLVYSKSLDWQPFKIERSESNNTHYKNPDNDPRGPWFSSNVQSPNPRKNLMFDIVSPSGCLIHPPKNGWRWSETKMKEFIEEGVIVFLDNGTRLVKKTYLKDQAGIVPSNIWWDIEETGHNRNAKYELKKIFPEINTSDLFKTPKPTRFINRILALASYKDSVVLDFFAGSGTTLHSVLMVNEKDKGSRQCIMVQSSEGDICERFTYERNKRVITGYTRPNGEQVEGLSANNLRYYRIDFVPRTQSPHDLRHLVNLSTDMLCIKEDLYCPAEIECNGKKIAKRYARRFQKGDREMIIIYEPKVIPLIVKHIKARDVKHEIKVYVNAPGRYAFDDDFSEVIDKITLCAIPNAILQAYRDVLPKAKDQELPPVNIDEGEIKKALEADSDYSYTDEKGGNQ